MDTVPQSKIYFSPIGLRGPNPTPAGRKAHHLGQGSRPGGRMGWGQIMPK